MYRSSIKRRKSILRQYCGQKGDFRGVESLEGRLLLSGEGLLISELMADNETTLQDENGDFSDWIEIHNPTESAVDLGGWHLTDDADDLAQWTFPSVTIEPGEFLVVFASGKDRINPGSELHTNFALSNGGEYLGLVRPDDSIAHEYAPEFPGLEDDESFGIVFDGATVLESGALVEYHVPTDNSFGLDWIEPDFVVEDEIWFEGDTALGFGLAVPGFTVRDMQSSTTVSSLGTVDSMIAGSAIATETTAITPVVNFLDTGGGGNFGSDLQFPNDAARNFADYNNFAIHATGTIIIPTAGIWTFGTNTDDGSRLRVDGIDVIVDDTLHGEQDRFGEINLTAGAHTIDYVFFERGGGAASELFAAQGSFNAFSNSFRLIGDTANGGLEVFTSPDGVAGAAGVSTDVSGAMLNENASIYVRIPFDVADAAALDSLSLEMQYNDGFVAYLNGVEVASRNAPGNPTFDSSALAERSVQDSFTVETINLTNHLGSLVDGENVLAIHGMNSSASDDSFLLSPRLVGGGIIASDPHFFDMPTPGSLNTGGTLGQVKDTKFTVDRGFYDDPFDVEISSGTEGAVIYYTLDGSEPSANNGIEYVGPISVTGTTTLRAVATKVGFESSDVDTQTYIFIEDIRQQGTNPAGFPSTWGPVSADYQVDPDVVGLNGADNFGGVYSNLFRESLLSIPTMSIVMNVDEVFGPGGIYSNSGASGVSWERAASLEYIDPNGGDEFQVNAGVRMHGGASRNAGFLKHNFRFLFKSQYGPSKLNFPLFGDGVDRFDTFILRAGFNNSWTIGGGQSNQAQFIRDQFIRNTHLAMERPASRGDFVHLYVNGLYWGLYNPSERPDASFSAETLGGEKENWDAINSSEPVDGNKAAWNMAHSIANSGVADQAGMDALSEYVDIPNLIDYMILNFYGGNQDWDGHNWYSGRLREPGAGYQFYSWDAERTIESITGHNRTGLSNGDKPSGLYGALRSNPEFRMMFADQAHGHLFNDGVLTPSKAIERYDALAERIELAIIGESARWGDKTRGTPYTRDVEWSNERNRILTQYLPQRAGVLVGQLRAADLYPDTDAPSFNQHGGEVPSGFDLVISNVNGGGVTYYTTDGSDPRLAGGGISPNAQVYTGAIDVLQEMNVRSRTLDGGEWSAINEAVFTLDTPPDLRVTEVMFNPAPADVGAGEGSFDNDEFEFIEIQNTGNTPIDLSGLQFTDGIDFQFAASQAETLISTGFANDTGGFGYGDDPFNGTANPDSASGRHGLVSTDASTAVVFDGTDDYVNLGQASAVSFDTGDAFTLSAWIKTDGDAGDIISKAETGNSQLRGYRFSVNNSGQIGFWLVSDLVSDRMFARSTVDGLGDNQWHHIVVTYDGSGLDTGVAMYIDGSDAVAEVTSYTGPITGTIQTDAPGNIGSRNGVLDRFDGSIDDPAVFDRVLTPVEVAGLVNSGNYGTAVNALSPVAFWKFDETGGPTAFDEAGNANGTYETFDVGAFSQPGHTSDPGGDLLSVRLGPGDTGGGASGAWSKSFSLGSSQEVEFRFDYRLTLAPDADPGEVVQFVVDVDGQRIGSDADGSIVQLVGDGDGGAEGDTGWQTVTHRMVLGAGQHTIRFGAFSNGFTDASEFADLLIDNVSAVTIPQSQISLGAGEYGVLVANVAAFESRYDTSGINILGEYSGALDNGGEHIRFESQLGQTVADFTYNDGWFDHTDGDGFSVVPIDVAQDILLWDEREGWRPSSAFHGSPGAADTGLGPDALVINEILAHSDGVEGDWIEIRNTTGTPVDISGWFLSDDGDDLTKFHIANGTVVPANGFVRFTEAGDFGNAGNGGVETLFAFSELGEAAYLSSVDTATGGPGGFRVGIEFGASDNGVTFGRYENTAGYIDFVATTSPTPGAVNAAPLAPDVIINEIHYNPKDVAPNVRGDEYVELYNRSGSEVSLFDPANPENTWAFTRGIDFVFPTGVTLGAGEYMVVVNTDPATFRAAHFVPANVQVFGPYTGSLDNGGERLELSRPGNPEPGGEAPMIANEHIRYNDVMPWPTTPDGNGPSLAKETQGGWGNEPGNWSAGTSGGTPGIENLFTDSTPPSTPTGLSATVTPGGQFQITWQASVDFQSGIDSYRIFRDGQEIGTSTGTSFIDAGVTFSDPHAYEVSAINGDGLEGARSAAMLTEVTSFQNGAEPNGGYSGMSDTVLRENQPDQTSGDVDPLEIDGEDSGGDLWGLFKWDLSGIPTDATILGASITMNVTNQSSGTYVLYQVKRDWSEAGASWNEFAPGQAWEVAGAQGVNDRGTTPLGNVSFGGTGVRTANLNAAGMALLQEWLDGTTPNYGFILGDTTPTDGLDVSSGETGSPTSRPKLSISYVTPTATPDEGQVEVNLVPRINATEQDTFVSLPLPDTDPVTGAGQDGDVFYQREGNTFLVEIWMRADQTVALGSTIASGVVDLGFDPAAAEILGVDHGSLFNINTVEVIDAVGGVVTVGGATTAVDLGDNEQVLLGRVLMQAKGDIDPLTQLFGPFDLELSIEANSAGFVLNGMDTTTVEFGNVPAVESRAVIYDFDNNDVVNFADLGYVLAAMGRPVGGSEPPYAVWADFDNDDVVDEIDRDLLLAAFGKAFTENLGIPETARSEGSSGGGGGIDLMKEAGGIG